MESLFLASNSMTFGERLSLAGQMLLVGMAVVFAVLALLWLLLAIMKFFVCDLGKKKNKAGNEVSAPAFDASTDADATSDTYADDGELVAAITAAIAAYRAENETEAANVPFKVVSYKRKSGNTEWNHQR